MSDARPFLEPRQAARRPATVWENDLADVIEAAFADGAWELDALVARLNASRIRPLDGGDWTAERFAAIVKTLGA